jgi:hypothetical protein
MAARSCRQISDFCKSQELKYALDADNRGGEKHPAKRKIIALWLKITKTTWRGQRCYGREEPGSCLA